jgi:hypothetical protein
MAYARLRFFPILICLTPIIARAEQGTVQREHIAVHYDGVEEKHAEALARVAIAARAAALVRFAFDVPERITIHIDLKPSAKTRFWTDGNDTFNLTVARVDDLAPPATSGVFNLYGMCHELGHVLMYRPIARHDWLTSEGAEGWAHYVGSCLVDDVYAAEGPAAWFVPYDYRADGMSRLDAQLRRDDRDKTIVAAGLWKGLVDTIGEKRVAPLFVAWGKLDIDAADPAPQLMRALRDVSNDATLAAWWDRAEPILIRKRPRSTFVANAAPSASGDTSRPASRPASHPTAPGTPNAPAKELALDDGKSAGKSSVAGGGHAVAFETPVEGSSVVGVKIFGSRYGTQAPPNEDFKVWLCDEDGKTIKEFPFPYKTFLRGDARWVTLKTEPTPVPKRFIVCVGFNPTATKGVFVHYDAKSDGDSRSGLPGELNDAFGKGDWMIRALVAE